MFIRGWAKSVAHPRISGFGVMGWEFRKGKLYYYEKKRIGKQVISQYVKKDLVGYAEALKGKATQTRELERLAERKKHDKNAEIDAALGANETDLKRQLADFMELAGYHQHKGTWRKKRKQAPKQ